MSSNTDDEDVLKGYDLDAWEAPAAPEDLADGVIARLGGTAVGAAVPVETGAPHRRAWLIAGVAAAALAATAGTYALIRSTHREGPRGGVVMADRAQALSIEGVKADLDRGADVRWTREGGAVRVEQRAGTAAWRVDGDSKLVIDAGAMVASVEATGASLRVEVQMNAMDGRVIGASALTAAAVAMVTVVVYEGHVKVSSAGQRVVIVEPGSTYQVPQPAPPLPTPQPTTPVIAGAPDDTAPTPVDDKAPVVQKKPPAAGSGEPANVTTTRCGEIDCVLSNYADACCAQYRAGTPSPEVADGGTSLDRAKISDAIAKVKPKIAACGEKFPAKGVVKLAVRVAPGGKVERVVVKQTPTAELGDCVQAVVARATFPATDSGGSFSYPFMFEGGAPSTSCDATKLNEEGVEKITVGMHAAALALFEQSLACKSDPKTLKLAYMASCNTQNAAKAKSYFAKLSTDEQDRLEQICLRKHIDVRAPYDFSTPAPARKDLR